MELSGLGTVLDEVRLAAVKNLKPAVDAKGATNSSDSPELTMVRNSPVRPGSATDGLNAYVRR
jgi:hypothetical protein